MGTEQSIERMTAAQITAKKADGAKIVCLTAYDYPSALVCDEAGVDLVLVGDSLGNVIHGEPTTLRVTMDDMLYHTRIVDRALKRAMLVGDMPFLSFSLGEIEAVRNAGEFVACGAQGVKIEWQPGIERVVGAISDAGIPVMGHLGLTPQAIHRIGGYRVQGRDAAQAELMLREAEKIERAGAFAIVLELVPTELARRITGAVKIPTIGIGAGPHTDGQILVFHDMLHMLPGKKLKHVKRYLDGFEAMARAVGEYSDEVRGGKFPGEEHGFS
ncbi:MAG TPA: 3-methyl-2-oxobutanoate hydroxymethyltransferase [bacterium]|nr:3-methyl-2-oxobutanoate hydroxymethyltransferase [bacterium]